ncbi:hypothetical protein ACFOLA_02690 [Salinicoccus hispanicus]|uniref:Uncharacterized protein n=1 Tax=Salinicoccus hispanicus TaxID=157225 RepID=A0A6N8TYC6_9STAP|nr:hypothetical protein [Salinicoccus hispanicus]MXQ50492.1 hypothetical protein [Salinicoccus hispanicus]
MFIRLILVIALSFFVIYGLNYLDLADVGYSFQTVAITAVTLIVLGLLYRVFTKFLKVILFVFVFLPLVAFGIYYIYSFFTGTPMELFDMDWIGRGAQWF